MCLSSLSWALGLGCKGRSGVWLEIVDGLKSTVLIMHNDFSCCSSNGGDLVLCSCWVIDVSLKLNGVF